MKTIYGFIIAALTTMLALAGCSKYNAAEIAAPDPVADNPRTIAVSFGTATRSTLGVDGETPKFVDGDEILVTTSPRNRDTQVETETCRVSVSGDNASFITSLTGELRAFYPASAVREGDKIGFCVSKTQSGKFADANLAGADIPAGANTATFENVDALLIITPPAHSIIRNLIIKSLPKIGDDGQRSGNPMQINTDEGDNYKITVSDRDSDGNYYVALLVGAKLSDLSFEAISDTGEGRGWMLGITEAQAGDESTTQRNVAYKIGGEANWHEYVTVGDYKWAKVNIKTSETDGNYDDYYVWGTTALAYSNISDIYAEPCSTAVMKTANPYGEEVYVRDTWSADNGFSWENCPFTYGVFSETNKNVFTKYVPLDQATTYGDSNFYDDKTRLDLCDDAAYVRWGGAWRIPTKEELSALGSDVPQNGTLKDKESSPLVFNNGSVGYYWSSTLCETNPSKAYCWKVSMGSDGPAGDLQEIDRYYGCTIRAIIDDYYSIPDPSSR